MAVPDERMKTPRTQALGLMRTISDEKEASMVMEACVLLEVESNKLNYSSAVELKQRTMIAIQRKFGCDVQKADQLYCMAANSVLPYLRSGEEMLKARAQLDFLTRLGQDNLIDKETGKLNEKIYSSLLNAIKIRHDIVSKTQANLISAKRAKTEQEVVDKVQLNIGEADRGQLERYLKEKLLPNPSVAAELIRAKSSQKKGSIDVGFDEGM